MLDWLAVGNGWRNLFLASSALQALALGTLFARHRLWVRGNRLGAFLIGASLTPLMQYLWMLLLAALWPHAPKLVYIGVLPGVSAVYLAGLIIANLKRIGALLARFGAWLKRLFAWDKPALVSLCFAAALAVLLAPVCIRTATSTYPAAADSGEYMALGLRYCEDRDLGELLSKDDATGHFRANSHFPSLELYMAYGLMHTGDTVGYPYDKPMFTAIGLLVGYLLLAYSALLILLTRGKRRWVLLGLILFNLVPNFVYSLSTAPRDTWRCLALMIAAVGLLGLRPDGGVWRYLGKLVFVTALCFTAMSAHVVGFVVLPFMVAAWVLLRWLESLYARDRRAGRTLLRSVGLALGGAAGTLAAYAGNLWCYLKWGQMSPWRLMTTFTNAPWYQSYMQGEYKLEATTTHLNFWQARYDIVMAYATPVGLWGMRLALIGLFAALTALAVRRLRGRRESAALRAALLREDGPVTVVWLDGQAGKHRMEVVSAALAASLMTLLTLAPMSGLLDTKLYSFSGSFLTMQRYTLQWFLFACCAVAGLLAAGEAAWPWLLTWAKNRFVGLYAAVRKRAPALSVWLQRAPAYACALLCALAFAQGTQESGYANSFYRYGRPMLTDASMALDTSFKERYRLLLQLNEQVPQGKKILVTRAGYQYALRARGYVLTSNPIVPLMNLPLNEVGDALAKMNVAALVTEPDFWDERYFSQSTLSEYLNSLPPEQIVQDGRMRVYLVDASLVGTLQVAPASALSPASAPAPAEAS